MHLLSSSGTHKTLTVEFTVSKRRMPVAEEASCTLAVSLAGSKSGDGQPACEDVHMQKGN